jgi:hypothetical protein
MGPANVATPRDSTDRASVVETCLPSFRYLELVPIHLSISWGTHPQERVSTDVSCTRAHTHFRDSLNGSIPDNHILIRISSLPLSHTRAHTRVHMHTHKPCAAAQRYSACRLSLSFSVSTCTCDPTNHQFAFLGGMLRRKALYSTDSHKVSEGACTRECKNAHVCGPIHFCCTCAPLCMSEPAADSAASRPCSSSCG